VFYVLHLFALLLQPEAASYHAVRPLVPSQSSQAVRVLVGAGLPVALTTLQQWEIARSSPRPLMVTALARFLVQQENLSTTSGPKTVAPVIERLKAWREANHLSQSQTVEALIAAGLPAKLRTLQDWETGRRSPRGLSTSALERFLDEHPEGITHPFSNRTPPPQSAGYHSSDIE
jgi:DNA-binding transcriptional regulator YiaG